MIQFQSERFFFAMNVLDYQYPDTTPLRFNWDANWLSVEITIGKEGKRFTFTDPCLLTRELPYLKEFLEQMRLETNVVTDSLGFIEPVLEFKYHYLGGNQFWLNVTVGVFHPIPGWPFKETKLNGLNLTFIIDTETAGKASEMIDLWIKKYPFRNIEE
ncbi:MAG: hypothetical protein Kow00108_27280 [Calditrichia bacterium]